MISPEVAAMIRKAVESTLCLTVVMLERQLQAEIERRLWERGRIYPGEVLLQVKRPEGGYIEYSMPETKIIKEIVFRVESASNVKHHNQQRAGSVRQH
jgi:hypothetical protein